MYRRYISEPIAPFSEAIAALVGVAPCLDFSLEGIHSSAELQEHELFALQEWINSSISSSSVPWATGGSVIDSADIVVAQAVENGNIPDPLE